jgi:hypothetical protein
MIDVLAGPSMVIEAPADLDGTEPANPVCSRVVSKRDRRLAIGICLFQHAMQHVNGRGRLKPWKQNAWFNNSRCSIQIVDLGMRANGRLRKSLVSQLAEQKVDFSTQQDGKTRKIKPYVQANSGA